MAPSSRGLGHRPFTAVTRVRLPSGSLGLVSVAIWHHQNPAIRWVLSFLDALLPLQGFPKPFAQSKQNGFSESEPSRFPVRPSQPSDGVVSKDNLLLSQSFFDSPNLFATLRSSAHILLLLANEPLLANGPTRGRQRWVHHLPPTLPPCKRPMVNRTVNQATICFDVHNTTHKSTQAKTAANHSVFLDRSGGRPDNLGSNRTSDFAEATVPRRFPK